MKVHLRVNGTKGPACGYHRWGCEVLTTNGNHAKVTCLRCQRIIKK